MRCISGLGGEVSAHSVVQGCADQIRCLQCWRRGVWRTLEHLTKEIVSVSADVPVQIVSRLSANVCRERHLLRDIDCLRLL